MKKLLIILSSLLLISAAAVVDFTLTDGSGTTANGTSVDAGGTVTKNIDYEPDSINLRSFTAGATIPFGLIQLKAASAISSPHRLININMTDNQFYLFSTNGSYSANLIVDADNGMTYDENSVVPKGIRYTSPISITDPLTLTYKSYTDRNTMVSYTKTTLPTTTFKGIIFVTNATGGACPAYSDGFNWRRFTDNSIIN